MTEGRKDDTGKRRWQLLRKGCVHALEAVIKVLEYGAKKYGDDNWKLVEQAEVRYRDALDRHLADLDKGIIYDPDTGEHQYAHVATNALFLLELHEARKSQLKPAGRWIKNLGKEPAGVMGCTAPIDLELRNGEIWRDRHPQGWRWEATGACGDIIYWRHSA